MPQDEPKIVPPHGGYRRLKSCQAAEIIYDAAVAFCGRFIGRRSRTCDQMVRAARSGKQNIAEGGVASGTSKKTGRKLVGVARASLEELLPGYRDFLRQRALPLWGKDHPQAQAVRRLAYVERGSAEVAANTLACLVHQANYLLDRQLRKLESAFLAEGGFTERLHRARSEARANP